ncbi:MAG: class I SAM-dependent methyltransferase [Chloroflexi bacterium]|nr:class I SAM-dependent methyltransferase [Chloroflexota bacterium]
MKRYAATIDLNNANSAWTILARWVGRNRRVLDVGCGRGQLGNVLRAQFDCAITGIEINSEYARECAGYDRVIIGSAEDDALLARIGESFDVIVCGDVLEHLREPEIPLRAFHDLLAPNGRLLISVPNVAHFRIRWMLLRGHWDYTPEGIMDATHLRWFTRASLRALVARCCWRADACDFTVSPNLGRWLHRAPALKKWLPPTWFAAQFLLNLSPEK